MAVAEPRVRERRRSPGVVESRTRALRGEVIEISGAREHNLRVVELTIPKNALVVFTGPSGSGKSSLAFDTLYAEGQRRYVEIAVGVCAPVFGPSSIGPRSIGCEASRRPSPSSRRARRTIRGPRSARSPRFTTTCACCGRASAANTARAAAKRLAAQSLDEIVADVLHSAARDADLAARSARHPSKGRIPRAVHRALEPRLRADPGKRRGPQARCSAAARQEAQARRRARSRSPDGRSRATLSDRRGGRARSARG